MPDEIKVDAEWLRAAVIERAPDGRALLLLAGARCALVVDLDAVLPDRGTSVRQQLVDALLVGCRVKSDAVTLKIDLDVSGLKQLGQQRSVARVIRDEQGNIASVETEGASFSTLER